MWRPVGTLFPVHPRRAKGLSGDLKVGRDSGATLAALGDPEKIVRAPRLAPVATPLRACSIPGHRLYMRTFRLLPGWFRAGRFPLRFDANGRGKSHPRIALAFGGAGDA